MKKSAALPLLEMVVPSEAKLKILVVESNEYLAALREMFPRAEIIAVTADARISKQAEYAGLQLSWQILDYRRRPLQLQKESLDYIFSVRCLEDAGNAQDMASGLGCFLKQTGFLLTQFTNLRYWQNLKLLQAGEMPAGRQHFYTKKDMETLLYASFYKEMMFVPAAGEPNEEFVQRLTAAGADNSRDDLQTAFWLVKAARSTAEIAALKSMYQPEERRYLAILLRRIEYGIELAANVPEFWRFYQQVGFFPAYTADFIAETIIHQEDFWRNLAAVESAEYSSLQEAYCSQHGQES